MIDIVIYKLKGTIDYYFVLLTLGIGLMTLFVDVKWLYKQGVEKEAKVAKIIGISYIIGGPLLYIMTKFM